MYNLYAYMNICTDICMFCYWCACNLYKQMFLCIKYFFFISGVFFVAFIDDGYSGQKFRQGRGNIRKKIGT